jgi:8-oxo-dGTP pyrophosphatase MutT (NUDIX family)
MGKHARDIENGRWSHDIGTQFGALCYRRHGSGLKILLVTSRGTGRWVIPKGWPVKGLSPQDVARREAWEEAGVRGDVRKTCLGQFPYQKWFSKGLERPCNVSVYPIKVRNLSVHFPEAKQRRRKWFTPRKAAEKVAECELAQILYEFDPKAL